MDLGKVQYDPPETDNDASRYGAVRCLPGASADPFRD